MQWLMVTLINARNVQKMMFYPTGIRILKKSEPTTGKGQKRLKELNWQRKSAEHGGKKTIVVLDHIAQLPEPLNKDCLYLVPALDAEKKNLLLTTKIMTNLWKLFGYVSHAINNVIKK